MNLLEIYSDFLLSQVDKATATELSRILDGKIGHDTITKFLKKASFDQGALWQFLSRQLKPTETCLSKVENCLVIDDTIIEKESRKENQQVCWHYDHGKSRCVKGVKLLTCFLNNPDIKLPVNYQVIEKPTVYKDKNTGKRRRKSDINTNERFRQLLQLSNQQLGGNFSVVLADSWFCANANMNYIDRNLGKIFIFGVKSNRQISLCQSDGTYATRYQELKSLELVGGRPYKCKVRGVKFPLQVLKRYFKNGDGSTGTAYFLTNDLTMDGEAISSCYQKRWSIEEYHRSLKQYASIGESQAWSLKAHTNHIHLSLVAYVKLVFLQSRLAKSMHHLRRDILLKANFGAMNELKNIKKLAA